MRAIQDLATRNVWALLVLALLMAACGDANDGDQAERPDSASSPVQGSDPIGDGEGETPSESVAAAELAEGEGASGTPIRIGVQTLEGDPAGSFPEYALSIEAATAYVNSELGGLNGRPIELEICKMVVTPDDSQRCANELSASGVDLVISTFNFFGNHFSIYQGSDIPVIVGTPITIGDFTSDNVFAIGAGGGCLGVHTGLVEFGTNQIEEIEGIEVRSVGVPWPDTPPGAVCYHDLEAKPLDVIIGTEPGDSERAGTRPEMTYRGVPMAPATPDLTPQATEILDSDPDVILLTAQASDCWNFIGAMERLGWTPDDVPVVMTGACTDFDAMRAADQAAVGTYFVGSSNSLLAPLETLEDGQEKQDATIYQTKALEYGLSEDDLFKGFSTQGFTIIMNLWELAETLDGDVSGSSIADALAATDGSRPTFGAAPLNCADAPEPYVAVCSSEVAVTRWTGDELEQVIPRLNAIDLIAGTELRPGG